MGAGWFRELGLRGGTIVIRKLRDKLVLAEVTVLEGAKDIGRRARKRTDRVLKEELGQTPTEYLMIVGLMAAVIVLVFATWYWDDVKTSAKDWVKKVKETVMGEKVK